MTTSLSEDEAPPLAVPKGRDEEGDSHGSDTGLAPVVFTRRRSPRHAEKSTAGVPDDTTDTLGAPTASDPHAVEVEASAEIPVAGQESAAPSDSVTRTVGVEPSPPTAHVVAPFSVPRLAMPWVDPHPSHETDDDSDLDHAVGLPPRLLDTSPVQLIPRPPPLPTPTAPVAQPAHLIPMSSVPRLPAPAPAPVPAPAPAPVPRPAPAAIAPAICPAAQTAPYAPALMSFVADPYQARPATVVRRRTGRRRVRGLAFFVVLALTATGAYFARTYLLEKSWDAEARAYADVVEDVRGVASSQPVIVSELDGPSFAARSYQVLVGGEQEALHAGAGRAMGLLAGPYNSVVTAGALADGRLAIFDPGSADVLVDASAPDTPERHAAIVREMDVALADQSLGWSTGWDDISPAERIVRRGFVDGGAALLGERWRQELTTQTLQVGPVAAPMAWGATGGRAGIPDDLMLESVLAGAAGTWATLGLGADWTASNRVGLPGARVTNDAMLWDPSTPVTGSPAVGGNAPGEMRGMGYWYLVLASRLDADQSWNAARSWVGDRQEVSDRAGRACVINTLYTGNDIGLFVLGSALLKWAELAPPESATTVDINPGGTILVTSCDPGVESSTRGRTTGPVELASFAAAGWHLAALVGTDAAIPCVLGEANRSGTVSSLAQTLRDTPEPARAGVLADPGWADHVQAFESAC